MAFLKFTESGWRLATRLMEERAAYSDPAIPVLCIRRTVGERENHRSPSGESIWEVVEPAGWKAEVGSWIDTPERRIMESTEVVRGVRVLLTPQAEAAPGSLEVSALDDQLVVTHGGI